MNGESKAFTDNIKGAYLQTQTKPHMTWKEVREAELVISMASVPCDCPAKVLRTSKKRSILVLYNSTQPQQEFVVVNDVENNTDKRTYKNMKSRLKN